VLEWLAEGARLGELYSAPGNPPLTIPPGKGQVEPLVSFAHPAFGHLPLRGLVSAHIFLA
jgi:hypothetical protein